MKGVEGRQDRAYDRNDKEKRSHPCSGAGVTGRQPIQQASAQSKECGIEHDARQQNTGGAATRAIKVGEPFIEWKKTKLRAESNNLDYFSDKIGGGGGFGGGSYDSATRKAMQEQSWDTRNSKQ